MNVQFINADEIMEIMAVKKTRAYEIIKQLNKEMCDKGYFTVPGRISKRYFYERIYVDPVIREPS